MDIDLWYRGDLLNAQPISCGSQLKIKKKKKKEEKKKKKKIIK